MFSKTTNCTRPTGSCNFVSLRKIDLRSFIPNCTRNHVITYTTWSYRNLHLDEINVMSFQKLVLLWNFWSIFSIFLLYGNIMKTSLKKSYSVNMLQMLGQMGQIRVVGGVYDCNERRVIPYNHNLSTLHYWFEKFWIQKFAV